MRWSERGFTLLEVLVAVAVLALALISLLGLHVRDIDLIGRDERITEATFLARTIMTEAEIERFPELGRTEGDFAEWYPDRFSGVRWERDVRPTPLPDLREIRVRVFRSDLESGDDVTLVYYAVRR